ncbi:MAG: DUF444 family protein [Bacteroidetes bacterium]|nr:DUF444 family protein [Bacteroidota bacterium]MBU1720965.1 DUF444 family protein [Bacteroidota bacterium]
MSNDLKKYYKKLQLNGLPPEADEYIRREIESAKKPPVADRHIHPPYTPGIYDKGDAQVLQSYTPPDDTPFSALKTLDELLDKDKQREHDGFPRRIRLGKLVKPGPDKKARVIIVPTTTEPKFYHDNSITEDGEEGDTGGSGEGEEGEVIGEQQAEQQQGEGEGQGAGQGESSEHDIGSEAFDLGRIITQKFNLPNLKDKGKKRSLTKYTYDLTDKNRRHGQLLDKKATIRRIIETNILLGNIDGENDFSPDQLILNPDDQVFRIMSKEKDFENQAVVFFVRDYSGSMAGPPTEAVITQHLLIYSWLMYQFQNNVITRFILHDTEAKEVPDFYTYYKSQVAGGTNVSPAFELVNKIVETEQLAKDYNIYVFFGTDGDDWQTDGKQMLEATRKMFTYINRLGITVAKNSWSTGRQTTVEKYIESSGILKQFPDLIRLDGFISAGVAENRLIEGIKKLIS